MYLGIEIGGTKLQLAVGRGDGSAPVDIARMQVDPRAGAEGILEQIKHTGGELLTRHNVERVGIGFGGPVDASRGCVTKSHHVPGWDDMPLVQWCERTFGLQARIDNDCNVAALAEARFGAGRGHRSVFYVTVGSGIGGGLAVDGQLFGTGRPAIAEIGHLRPGPQADQPQSTVESTASGWGIADWTRRALTAAEPMTQDSTTRDADRDQIDPAATYHQDHADLLDRCGGSLQTLTAEVVSHAAAEGNSLAQQALEHAIKTLGWAIAQTITLLAVEVVVVGGGVSRIGEQRFLQPLRQEIRRYVFPPLSESYEIVASALGELVVVHGALALAVG